MLSGQGFFARSANSSRRIADREAPKAFRPARREGDTKNAADRFAHVMHLTEAGGVHKSVHVRNQFVDRPLMVRPRVARLTVAAHITTQYTIVPSQPRHPVIPELRTAPDAMLQPDRLGAGDPGIGVVID